MNTCAICHKQHRDHAKYVHHSVLSLCKECLEAYDVLIQNDVTTMGLIKWVTERVWAIKGTL